MSIPPSPCAPLHPIDGEATRTLSPRSSGQPPSSTASLPSSRAKPRDPTNVGCSRAGRREKTLRTEPLPTDLGLRIEARPHATSERCSELAGVDTAKPLRPLAPDRRGSDSDAVSPFLRAASVIHSLPSVIPSEAEGSNERRLLQSCSKGEDALHRGPADRPPSENRSTPPRRLHPNRQQSSSSSPRSSGRVPSSMPAISS